MLRSFATHTLAPPVPSTYPNTVHACAHACAHCQSHPGCSSLCGKAPPATRTAALPGSHASGHPGQRAQVLKRLGYNANSAESDGYLLLSDTPMAELVPLGHIVPGRTERLPMPILAKKQTRPTAEGAPLRASIVASAKARGAMCARGSTARCMKT